MRDQITTTTDPESMLAAAQAESYAAAEALREAIKQKQEAAAIRVQSLGSILQRLVDERVSLRSEIEERWLKSIRQINGIYEPGDLPPAKNGEYGSRLYVPLTRRLRNLAEARLADMLFPSDDRSYILDPSPVAELSDVANMLNEVPDEAPVSVPGMPEGMNAADMKGAIKDVQKEAEIRASRMQRQVDDRLAEARWPAKARKAISDAVDLGTGVVKGPLAVRRTKRTMVADGQGGYTATMKEEVVPSVEYVDVWNFYPDLSGTTMDEVIDVAESHPMSRKDLQGLRGQPGFNDAAIDMVLKGDPRPDGKTRRNDLRQISGLSAAEDPRYTVWEYHGPLKGTDLNAACDHAEGYDETGEPMYQGELFDAEEEYSGVVWFCDGIVLKAIVRPFDTQQKHIYSVVWWQRDKSSIFGFGLPDETRDQQASANGSFRAMHDNMGLTVGPQIVYDDEVIKPVDGDYTLSPFKLWKKTNPSASVSQAFGFYQIDSRVSELSMLFDKSKALMEEVATMPAMMAGSEQPNYLQTATGASMAYNASTLWVRRVVRHWDDDVIEPLMGRMVDWEMDFNEDSTIKGDYKPIAKGITALVELEGQGQRMTAFTQLAQSMGVPLKDQMRILRQFARSLKLDPDELLPTEEEIGAMQDGAEQPDPETVKAQQKAENDKMVHEAKMANLSLKNAEMEARSDEYGRRERLALMELSSRERISMEQAAQRYGFDLKKLEAEISSNQSKQAHEAQMQNAEMALKLRMGSGI